MKFVQLMADIRVYVSCKFELYIFEIAQVIGENVPIGFLNVLSIHVPAFCIRENKDALQLNSAFVLATKVVQSLYFLNPTFQVSKYLLWLNSLICVGLALSETPKTGLS